MMNNLCPQDILDGSLGQVLDGLRSRTKEIEQNHLSSDNKELDESSDKELASSTIIAGEIVEQLKLIKQRIMNDHDDTYCLSLGRECSNKKTTKKKNISKRVDFRKLGLDPAPDYSLELKSRIGVEEGDTDMKLVIMKQLYKTDLDDHQDRLSIPLKQINDRENLLTEEEKNKIRSEGIEVKLVHPDLQTVSNMVLRKRDMTSSSSYALTSSWNCVVERNKKDLKIDDIVQLYSFRRHGKLSFVLIKIRDGEEFEDHVDGAGTSQVNENGAGKQELVVTEMAVVQAKHSGDQG